MAKYLIEEDTLRKIADAIRSKTGGSRDIQVSHMDKEISSIVIPEIPEIPEISLTDLTVIPTGVEEIFIPTDGSDGFKTVTVAGDSNLIPENIRRGVLIYGTLGELDTESENIELIDLLITNNGDYLAPEGFGFSKVSVNVETSSGGIKQINIEKINDEIKREFNSKRVEIIWIKNITEET